jgi:hypothetical protein
LDFCLNLLQNFLATPRGVGHKLLQVLTIIVGVNHSSGDISVTIAGLAFEARTETLPDGSESFP